MAARVAEIERTVRHCRSETVYAARLNLPRLPSQTSKAHEAVLEYYNKINKLCIELHIG